VTDSSLAPANKSKYPELNEAQAKKLKQLSIVSLSEKSKVRPVALLQAWGGADIGCAGAAVRAAAGAIRCWERTGPRGFSDRFHICGMGLLNAGCPI
jgi:hypothetical protein